MVSNLPRSSPKRGQLFKVEVTAEVQVSVCIKEDAAKVVGDKPKSPSSARKDEGKSCMSAPSQLTG